MIINYWPECIDKDAYLFTSWPARRDYPLSRLWGWTLHTRLWTSFLNSPQLLRFHRVLALLLRWLLRSSFLRSLSTLPQWALTQTSSNRSLRWGTRSFQPQLHYKSPQSSLTQPRSSLLHPLLSHGHLPYTRRSTHWDRWWATSRWSHHCQCTRRPWSGHIAFHLPHKKKALVFPLSFCTWNWE